MVDNPEKQKKAETVCKGHFITAWTVLLDSEGYGQVISLKS